MAKILLNKKNIEEHICRQTGSLYADKNMIISPGIKDYLQNEGISIVYGARPEAVNVVKSSPAGDTAESEGAGECCGDPGLAALAGRIVAILQKEYQVTDEAQVKELCLRVIKQIDQK